MSEPDLLAKRRRDSPVALASRAIVGLIGCIAFINVYAMQSVLALLSPVMGLLSDAWGRSA